MRVSLFTLPLLAFALALPVTSVNAQPVYKPLAPADYKVPEADLEKWAARLRKLCPDKGWTVSVENNDVLIQCDKPAVFRHLSGYSQNPRSKGGRAKASPPYEAIYRLRLRFSPFITQDKYEQLAAENAATFGQQDLLLNKYHLARLMTEVTNIGDSATANQRKGDYWKESAKLKFHILPDFYSTDYSSTLYRSWSESEYLDLSDETVGKECEEVLATVARFFGTYAPYVAKYGRYDGLQEPRN